ncbi:hypothetical protein L596_014742 [Steinernema carpocapsae]|uniref:Uncharacterized protein n=1 Tax=Steinernema carpocapsae TaxID=34508 RepID=A0A4V6A2W2_STECR|nr:hypothetical protein L596_014742 [Steinernema carpocapsae]
MDPLETASKRPHLVDVSELLINAESELLQNIASHYEFWTILEVVSKQLNDRRVRHLKGACTDRSDMKDRLWNLAMFLALKTHLKP